jgi:hypothetical protein
LEFLYKCTQAKALPGTRKEPNILEIQCNIPSLSPGTICLIKHSFWRPSNALTMKLDRPVE